MPMLFLDRHHFSADHSMFHSTYEVRMPVHSAKDALDPEGRILREDLKIGKNGTKAITVGHKKHLPNSDSVSNCTSNCISSDTVNLLTDPPGIYQQ